mmetsp:Transcript_6264/g.9100  ORF Transcript_6264/g.9100 Transcript_6264/m.9100 type:complete len:308 (+) Transcript_6264:58-981(+)
MVSDREGATEKKKYRRERSELRSLQRASLRKKNAGIGIGKVQLEGDVDNCNKKIRFGDDYFAEEFDQNEIVEKSAVEISKESKDSDEDSDVVEEVKSSDARKEIQEIRLAEHETKRVVSLLANKRKRKSNTTSVIKDEGKTENEEELNEHFFAQVDTELLNEQEVRKNQKKTSSANDKNLERSARRTTFVSEDDLNLKQVNVDSQNHNIEVILLPAIKEAYQSNHFSSDSNERRALAISSKLGTKPSQVALTFCRSRHGNGSGTKNLNTKMSSKDIKIKEIKDHSWKRSKRTKHKFALGRPSKAFLL